ncbi:hypothetical protein BTO15_03845 [Polaribacter sejongensis]|uniref:DUF4302 domain-containing protein n=1 Tax=Polaribacter sejongensis TaxID=985043 RepID=A0AAJ1VJU9_9FLAO|nr:MULTISPECIES: DUF4302 domain-containing protein [Polaribacter]AUC21291.1 hypothetical protein BTO15_03845 [Polaribacter sejongensis]MDN3620997.1 DUF4302 domain-containing protein [Polaribacter undariae]UWD31129.1 DUF4302 domain-containing protein [Polaribacter undariae]
MKKYIKKSLAFLLLIVMATSCIDNTEEMVFEESSSDRIQNAISEYKDLLTSSENGWVVEYYAGIDQSNGGFNFVMKFNEDLTSNVLMELAFDDSQSNMYDVIASGGPVLTFNTYNWLTHFFATPSPTNADGFEGDYEFFLLSMTDDVITMKGKKFGNIMRMVKFSGVADDFLTDVNGISYVLSLASGVAVNGEDNNVALGGRHLAFSIAGEEAVDVAYIFTTTGIKLYEPITIDGNEILEFTLDKAKNQLISIDGSLIIDLIIAPFDINQDWTISTFLPDISANFFSKYIEIYDANGALYGETLQRSISFGNTVNGSGIQFQSLEGPSTFWTSEYNLAFSAVLGNSDQIAIAKAGEGLNWSYYTHLNPLVDYIVDNAPYTAELATPTNPTEVKLTSTVDANAWFVIKL